MSLFSTFQDPGDVTRGLDPFGAFRTAKFVILGATHLCSFIAAVRKKRWESRSDSWVHIRAVSEIETDRLHHLASGALREDVCGGELAGVLFDYRLRCGPRYLV